MNGQSARRRSAISTSWDDNAANWTRAVRNREIASRRDGTDTAMIAAVTAALPGSGVSRLLDAGCGEGWLARAIAGSVPDCHVVGIDGSSDLIEAARAAEPTGPASRRPIFELVSYSDFADGWARRMPSFDVVAFNYALLDDDDAIRGVLRAAAAATAPGGAVVIQTVLTEDSEPDGWLTEDFSGFSGTGWSPMPWYRRSSSSWRRVVADSGMPRIDMATPAGVAGGRPLSLLMTCRE